jgi:molybdate transport system ATP-binding protein
VIKIAVKKKIVTTEGAQTLDINVEVAKGEITGLYGKSGVGKTTMLRMIAGLTKPDEGCIEVGRETWFDSEAGINLKPQERHSGFVFQDYALFPNMTVRKNIEFALKDKTQDGIVDTLLNDTDLTRLQDRFPKKVSGGQKQRVALARALAMESELLLLDEPLSALDIEMRLQLQDLLLAVNEKYQKTMLLVSHDLPEIFRLCQTVLVLESGKIEKQGRPKDVFDSDLLKRQFQHIIDGCD